MVKTALLIGTTDYEPGLSPLPSAREDVQAMERILRDGNLGGFDKIEVLNDPEPVAMQTAIETLFSSANRQDLTLLYLSGHGIKDDSGRLYFATRITRKNNRGELIKATAVPANFVQGIMSDSRCKRQVVILDCCFSGAFAEGMTAKDDGKIDIADQLGGEGRAVLTSSSATQYSFEDETDSLSVYTRFIVEGIEKGVADTDNDGMVSIDELHEYAAQKVQEVSPAMKPKIYAVEQGFKILLAKAAVGDPQTRYRKEVEHFASRGEISTIGRYTLDALRQELNLDQAATEKVESEVLQPYREYQEKLKRYKTALEQALKKESPLSQTTREDLDRYQLVLGLTDEAVQPVRDRLIPKAASPKTASPKTAGSKTINESDQAKPSSAPPAQTLPPVSVDATAPTQQQMLADISPAQGNSRKMPILIGGGLGAIALVIGLIAVLVSGPPMEERNRGEGPEPPPPSPGENYTCECLEPRGCANPQEPEAPPIPPGEGFDDVLQDEIRAFEDEGFACDY
ncbi:MAG: caspase family protein [Cyanobacteria bacterium P01_H01_bin.119]